VGVAVIGAAGAGRRGSAAAAAAAAWPLGPQAVPRLGGVPAAVHLDLRHDPLHQRRGGRHRDRGPCVEETATQVEIVFTQALEREGLLGLVGARQDGLVDTSVDDPSRPILLAMSDNGPQMTSGSTREFMALCAIHQHFGRPGTPTDQAWIESLFGHVKAEWPHLTKIRDPATLRAELAVVRERYNGVRLHAGIG
jgi:transposase InsO family protein